MDFVSSGRYSRNALQAAQNASSALDTSDCVQTYAERVDALVGNKTTLPAEVIEILKSFHLADFPPGAWPCRRSPSLSAVCALRTPLLSYSSATCPP